MAVRIEDIDKAIAEVIGSFDGLKEVKRGYREIYSKERHNAISDSCSLRNWQK